MSRLPLSMQSSQMYDPSSPLMSRPTSLDFLPQNEQDGSSLLWLGILPRWTGFPCNANLGDDLVYDAILHRLFGRHEEVSFGISSHNLKRFSRMGGKNLASHTGKPLEIVRRDTERDFFMSAEEAVEYGIVDQVISKIGVAGEAGPLGKNAQPQ